MGYSRKFFFVEIEFFAVIQLESFKLIQLKIFKQSIFVIRFFFVPELKLFELVVVSVVVFQLVQRRKRCGYIAFIAL
jgi:hypothetical protein